MSGEIPPTVRGYEYSEVVSALQKAIRRSDAEQAMYWSVELEASNFGEAMWRRLRVIASEDVGIAAPGIASEVRALYDNWSDFRKRREDRQRSWRLFTSHAVLALVSAPKSRTVDSALITFWAEIDRGDAPRLEIPDWAVDKHCLRGKKRGRSWDHFWTVGSMLVDPRSGEMSEAPSGVPDPFRDRAIEATRRPVSTLKQGQQTLLEDES